MYGACSDHLWNLIILLVRNSKKSPNKLLNQHVRFQYHGILSSAKNVQNFQARASLNEAKKYIGVYQRRCHIRRRTRRRCRSAGRWDNWSTPWAPARAPRWRARQASAGSARWCGRSDTTSTFVPFMNSTTLLNPTTLPSAASISGLSTVRHRTNRPRAGSRSYAAHPRARRWARAGCRGQGDSCGARWR